MLSVMHDATEPDTWMALQGEQRSVNADLFYCLSAAGNSKT